MLDLNPLIGHLIASIWQRQRARLFADDLQGEATRELDQGLTQLWDLVSARLRDDPALAKLFSEISATGDASDRTRRRVEDAIADAAETDAVFAQSLASLLSLIQEAQGGESQPPDVTDGPSSSSTSVSLEGESRQTITVSGTKRSTTSINSSWIITKIRKNPSQIGIYAVAIVLIIALLLGTRTIYDHIQATPDKSGLVVATKTTTLARSTPSKTPVRSTVNPWVSQSGSEVTAADLKNRLKNRIVDPAGWTYTLSDAHITTYPEYRSNDSMSKVLARPGTTFAYVVLAARNDMTDRSAPMLDVAWGLPKADLDGKCEFRSETLIPGWCTYVSDDWRVKCSYWGDVDEAALTGRTIPVGGIALIACVAEYEIPAKYDLSRIRVGIRQDSPGSYSYDVRRIPIQVVPTPPRG